MKRPATINLMSEVLSIMDAEAKNYGVSRSALIESQSILSAYNLGYLPAECEIDGIVSDFSVNASSKITAEFRHNILAMQPTTRWAVCAFFAGINIVEHSRVTTQKMANLWKGDALVCYFALNQVAGREIDTLTRHLEKSVVGDPNAVEYVYLANLQQFKIANPYPKWHALLSALSIPSSTAVLKVEPRELVTSILPAFQAI